jgi:hypothetical protein
LTYVAEAVTGPAVGKADFKIDPPVRGSPPSALAAYSKAVRGMRSPAGSALARERGKEIDSKT